MKLCTTKVKTTRTSLCCYRCIMLLYIYIYIYILLLLFIITDCVIITILLLLIIDCYYWLRCYVIVYAVIDVYIFAYILNTTYVFFCDSSIFRQLTIWFGYFPEFIDWLITQFSFFHQIKVYFIMFRQIFYAYIRDINSVFLYDAPIFRKW